MKDSKTAASGCCFPKCQQCTATSKRTGRRCRAPAVKGWTVCRFHGARSNPPTGPSHGRYRHGCYTKEEKEMRREVRELLRESRALVAKLKV